MPVIIPAGYGEITLVFEGALIPDGVGATVFGTELLDGGSLPDTLNAWVDSWEQHIQPSQHTSLTLVDATITTATTVVGISPGSAGGFSADPAPPNVALHVRKRTEARGRRAVGHMYPPGLVPDSWVGVDGTIGSSQLTAMQVQFDLFLNDVLAPMVILARSEGQSPPPAQPHAVVQLQVDQLVSTQRKRLR